MKFSAPTNTKRRIVILGSTGSVGTQALEVINQAPDRFEIAALAAGGANHELLAQQVVRTGARAVAVATGTGEDLETAIAQAACRAGVDNHRPQIFTGPDAVAHVAAWPNADVVLNAVTGSIGLAPTLAALNAGHLLALAQ